MWPKCTFFLLSEEMHETVYFRNLNVTYILQCLCDFLYILSTCIVGKSTQIFMELNKNIIAYEHI